MIHISALQTNNLLSGFIDDTPSDRGSFAARPSASI